MLVSWISTIIVLCGTVASNSWAKQTNEQIIKRKLFDPIFKRGKERSDRLSLPYKRVTQLYSRNSGYHIRILPNRKIDAQGEDGNKYAKLVIESDSFGRVRIRGVATNFYLCMDKRKRIRARSSGQGKASCTFQEHFASNAYTEFTSVKNKKNPQFLAFNRRGKQRACNKTRSGMKAVQFIERPLKHRRLYRGRMKNGRMEPALRGHSICITVKSWKEWRTFLKWRKQKRKAMRKLRKTKGKKSRRGLKKSSRRNPTATKKVAKKTSRRKKSSSTTPPLGTTVMTPTPSRRRSNQITPKS